MGPTGRVRKIKVNVTQGDGCTTCASGTEAYVPDARTVYIKFNANVQLSKSGTFTVRDTATRDVALQYNLRYNNTLKYVSTGQDRNPWSTKGAGPFVRIELPQSLLQGSKSYTLSLSEGFVFNPAWDRRNDIVPGIMWDISTPDVAAPKVVSRTPNYDQTGVARLPSTLSMTFNEKVKINSPLWGQAKLLNARGEQVALLRPSMDIKNANTVKFAVMSDRKLSASTKHFVSIPNGLISDMSNNLFPGTQFTGCGAPCDWQFTTATTYAPAIVGAPGSYCNNTLDLGEVGVTPFVGEQGVLVTSSSISFRWCNTTRPGTSGFITIKEKEGESAIAGIDLSDRKGIMTSSQTLQANDTYHVGFAGNALQYDTTYTVVIKEGTFFSTTNEPNTYFEWDFKTDKKPVSIELRKTYPVHNTLQNKTAYKNSISITYDQDVFIGKAGIIRMYKASDNGGDPIPVLEVDVANKNQLLQHIPRDAQRRSAAGTTAVACSPCVWTVGPDVHMAVPKSTGIVSDGARFAGTIDRGTVTGSQGQPGPAVYKADWQWQTTSSLPGVAFNNPPAAQAVTPPAGTTAVTTGSSGLNLGLLIGMMAAVLGVVSIGSAAALYNQPKPSEESDEESSGSEFGETGFDEPGQVIGKEPPPVAKEYKPPLNPIAVGPLNQVQTLVATIKDVDSAIAVPEQTELQPQDALTRLRGAVMRASIKTVQGDEPEISKDDIKTAASAIQLVRETLAGHKTGMWALKAKMMNLKVVEEKLGAIGEPLPALARLREHFLVFNAQQAHIKKIEKMDEKGTHHNLRKPKNPVTEDELRYMAAQAWPEVSRLRLERAARMNINSLDSGVQAALRENSNLDELALLTQVQKAEGDRLDEEANILQAACKVGCLVPLILAPKLNTQHATIQVMENPTLTEPDEKKDASVITGVIDVEMMPQKPLAVKNPTILAAEAVLADYAAIIHGEAKGHSSDADALLAAIKTLENIKLSDNAPTPKQIELLQQAVAELSPVMIDMYAHNRNIAGPTLERMLVAAQRAATGDSSTYYLKAVIEEIQPQIGRIKEKEKEVELLSNLFEKMEAILNSNNAEIMKMEKLEKLMGEKSPTLGPSGKAVPWQEAVKTMLQGHMLRYAGWERQTPSFNTKQPRSHSAELRTMTAIVTACESAVQNGSDDVINSARSEAYRLYAPCKVNAEICAQFAKCLTVMEKFAHGDENPDTGAPYTVDDMEAGIKDGVPVLKELRKDPKLAMAGLAAVFDLAARIIRRSKNEPNYYENGGNQPGEVKEEFVKALQDSWTNQAVLQSELHANEVTQELVQILEAKRTGDKSLDQLQAYLVNARAVLNRLLEEDRDLYDENALLKAIENLQTPSDPEKTNEAVQETQIQLANIKVTEQHTEALKTMHAHFMLFTQDGGDKDMAQERLTEDVIDFSPLVVKLAALEDDAGPMRESLVLAKLLTEAYKVNSPDLKTLEARVMLLASTTIRPEVALHCSAPKSAKLNTLMATIETLVDKQQEAKSSKDNVVVLLDAKKEVEKVQEEMDDHRRRLAYRNRMQVSKKSTECIDLRRAEAGGAFWEGFQMENYDPLKHVTDNRSEMEKAFDCFDIDRDGEITLEEVMQYLLSVPANKRPKGLEDVNPFQKKKMEKRLRGMDTDGDGKLSFAEFSEWWTSQHGEEA